MPTGFSFNPFVTTNASGLFTKETTGYVQGVMSDDPAIRFTLAGGILASTETLPMWGGVAISESIPSTGDDRAALGGSIVRSTLTANITGFSVSNQAHNWVSSPQSEVPTAAAGMGVPFARLGSGARVAVQLDVALANALASGLITQQVSWDLTAQKLIQYNAAQGVETISSITWSGGVATVTTSAAHGYLSGTYVVISGAVPTAYNGSQLITVTGATTFTFALAATTINATTPGQVNAGGGALPCKILQYNIGNSKVVTYDSVNNYVHWNNSGSCAVILI